ncbi:MAG: FG-GAP repeat protein [Rhodopirellula sp.]|nr:FG-GAP repeat protein [Rhodopirellula sp.]
MLLTDWLTRLSASHLQNCDQNRPARSRRRGVRLARTADVSIQPESLEQRLLLSAANVMLSEVAGTAGFQLSGESPAIGNFGNGIRPAGDVNGDGFEDVIIGANYQNNSAGAAYVLFGRSNGFSPVPNLDTFTSADGFAIRGLNGSSPGPADFAGTAVSGAGDINGDGFDDLVVVNSKYSATYDGGSGYVIFGKSNNTDVNLSTIDTGASDTVGFRIAGLGNTEQLVNTADFAGTAGDINGDGYDDVVFGSPKTPVGGGYGTGAAYVVFGKSSGFANLNVSDLNGTNGFEFTDSLNSSSISNQGYIGATVSLQGDLNGDGFSDLVVGAPKRSGYDGEIFVVFGRSSFSATVEVNSLNGTTGFKATGTTGQQAKTGVAISSGGDVNGDGIDDFVIGAPGSYDYAHVQGRAYVVFGKTNLGSSGTLNLTALSGSSGFILNGAANYDFAGTSVSITGDINGDGFDDIVVGTPTLPLGDVSSPDAANGKAYVVFGASSIAVPANLDAVNGVNGFKLIGSAGQYAGSRVALGADLNGDGFDELFIGEPSGSRITVFFGTDFLLHDGNSGNGELGNARQLSDGATAGTLTATQNSGADILVGGGGNDTLNADGGADVLIGGQGDDVLAASFTNFATAFRFDGGTGVDVLTGDSTFANQTVDLTAVPGNRINDIEIIDLEDAATETLVLNLKTVLAITGAGTTIASSSPFATNDAHTLTILRDADDVINGIADGVNGWTQGANQSIDGKTFEVFTQAGATVRIQSTVTATGNIDGDGDFDTNDSFMINIVLLGASDSLINSSKGASPLTAQEIRDNITALLASGTFDVDGDGDSESNDSFLVNIVKLGASDALVNSSKGASPLTAAQIKANVAALTPSAGRPQSPLQTAVTTSTNSTSGSTPPIAPSFLAPVQQDASESSLPEIPSFLSPPPVPLLQNEQSVAVQSTYGDDLSGVGQVTASSNQNPDEAFITNQLDVMMNLLS